MRRTAAAARSSASRRRSSGVERGFDHGRHAARVEGAERLQPARPFGNRRRSSCAFERVAKQREELGGDERHVPRDDEGAARACESAPRAIQRGCRAPRARRRQRARSASQRAASSELLTRIELDWRRREALGDAIDDSQAADGVKSLRRAAEARACAAGDDGADQARSPRCCAASSRPAVNARSTIELVRGQAAPLLEVAAARIADRQLVAEIRRRRRGQRRAARARRSRGSLAAPCATWCRTASRRACGAWVSSNTRSGDAPQHGHCFPAPLRERHAFRHVARGAREHGVADDAGDGARQSTRRVDRGRLAIGPPDDELRRVELASTELGELGRRRDAGALEGRRGALERVRQIARRVEKRAWRRTPRVPRESAPARAPRRTSRAHGGARSSCACDQRPELLGETAARGGRSRGRF